MKKRILTLLAIVLIFTSFVNSYGAAYVESQNNGTIVKTPTSFSYKDIIKIEEIATVANGKQVKVVNAIKYNNDNNVWIARLKFGTDENSEYADFLLTTLPYTKNIETNKVVSLPFNTVEEGCKLYGAKWYYFGILDDKTHNTCGYIVAQRIKRWSKPYDLTFTGKTKAGVIYTGAYTEDSNDEFLKLHIEVLG